MDEEDSNEELPESPAPPVRRKRRNRLLRWFWDAGEPAPSEAWRMVKRALEEIGEDPELSPDDERVALIAYFDDEPSRNNRMGSVLTGLGGIGAGGGLVPLLVEDGSPPALVFLAAIGFALVFAGQGIKLVGMKREGIGPMVAAILKNRYDL